MDEKKNSETSRGQREECTAEKISGGVVTRKQATPLVRDEVAAKPQNLR